MINATVIGHYGGDKTFLDGQTVKTKIVTDELIKRYGSGSVQTLDTYRVNRKLLYLTFAIIKALKNSNNVIILPAQNGLKVFVPLLICFNHFFHRRLHYCVIGGWLPSLIQNKNGLKSKLKKFDGIYVETSIMKNALEEQDFSNVVLMPNCKDLKIVGENELVFIQSEPYRLCTFSRVMKEKGIEDIVEAVKKINNKYQRVLCTLDIYGQVDSGQVDWFENLKRDFPEYVKYEGCIDFDKSVDVIKNYFLMVFPTHFFTEGIPGSIIDAYAAGVPVVATKWESFSDIIDEGKTGFGYDFGKNEELPILLEKLFSKPADVNMIKKNCIRKAKEYIPSSVVNNLAMHLR